MKVARASIELVKAQAGAGTPLPIIATVLDEAGCPLPGCHVSFQLTGTGSLFPSGSAILTGRTDRLGETLVTWKPPAGADETAGQPATITAHCEGPRATTIHLESWAPRQAGDLAGQASAGQASASQAPASQASASRA